MAKELGRKPLGAKRKLQRMGVVVGKRKIKKTTTTVPLSSEIPTHKEALKALVGAIDLLRKPDQDKLELQCLRILVDSIHVYDPVPEKFERWAETEARLMEMDTMARAHSEILLCKRT